MAWTQADLDALDRAIKQGVKSIRHGDETLEFQTVADMLRLRGLMQAEISGKGAGSTTVGVYRSGLRAARYLGQRWWR
jgi:hypothetical protein